MNFLSLLTIFSFISCYSSLKLFRKRWTFEEPHTYINESLDDKYFDQKLDHFNPSNAQTWKQRYFENNAFYKPGGPVFLMIGGESEASANRALTGAWIIYAQKYNANCLLLEHRFYGYSRPTGDLSVKNLTYLSSEQALADVAWFITSFSTKMNVTLPPKWIVFGGSYSGSLAAWMRLKYPHLVYGAVSSSGPLLALTDFKEYFGVVRDSLAAYDPRCVSAIEKGTSQFSSMLDHPMGQNSVFKMFRLCDPLDVNNKKDISNLYDNLASNFADVVQYSKDNIKIDVTIDRVCDIMLNKSIGLEVNRLAEVNSVMLSFSLKSCLDFKYDKMIKEARETRWNHQPSPGLRQWTYQTCTEFGFYQSSDLNITKKMFGDEFPIEFIVNQCADIFGSKFDTKFVNEAVSSTNSMYGGLNNQADNVIYIQGSIDPWHVLGITKTLKKGAPSIFIKGTAHCANMYSPSINDPPQLIAARKEIEKIIGEWLTQ